MKRILIVNVNWLGDVLFSTPIFKALKKKYPNSYIACMIPARCKEILEGNPNLDEIILFNERAEQKGMFAKLRFISQLKKKDFDTAFLLHRSFTKALIVYLSGIPERIGYFRKKRNLLLTKSIIPPDKDRVHRLEYYLNLIESQGIKVEDKSCEVFVSEADKEHIKNLLIENGISDNDFVVAINPGGNWNLKRWPKGHFAELADKLVSDLDVKIIITGAKKDIRLAEEISNLMKAKPIIFCGKTTLKQLAALFKKVNLVISADSGPMHIANALGAKLIALFGPTSPGITGPYNKENCIILKSEVNCKIPCYILDCKNNICMKNIKPDEVLGEIKKEFNY
ncbi:MAG: lipopolysaccharide heptosyltransferase II [Candidatus Omnitrophica bacterium]|nr:lipopolysaccharide heptosyltransferase II [Candidatus Omnitrophota bacterium]